MQKRHIISRQIFQSNQHLNQNLIFMMKSLAFPTDVLKILPLLVSRGLAPLYSAWLIKIHVMFSFINSSHQRNLLWVYITDVQITNYEVILISQWFTLSPFSINNHRHSNLKSKLIIERFPYNDWATVFEIWTIRPVK